MLSWVPTGAFARLLNSAFQSWRYLAASPGEKGRMVGMHLIPEGKKIHASKAGTTEQQDCQCMGFRREL